MFETAIKNLHSLVIHNYRYYQVELQKQKKDKDGNSRLMLTYQVRGVRKRIRAITNHLEATWRIMRKK